MMAMTYDYSIYQIENGPIHQTNEQAPPVCGFMFRYDANVFCKWLNDRYSNLRFIYTDCDREETM